jgi:protein-S-isoprenylcysteine O-methyltransferase Ste14
MRSFLFRRGFILPVMVTGVVPLVLAVLTVAPNTLAVPMIVAGALIFAPGLALLMVTTGLFARHHGSLAPWNPPAALVVVGPYRYCRNPMISGVYAMLLGEAVALQSPWLAVWALAFVIGMSSHIVLHEEPMLRKRFGESYATYCKHVPRWFPRLTPYESTAAAG